MAMFAMHRRSSIVRCFSPSPVNSMDLYSAPSTPILPMMDKITSLPPTQGPGFPVRTNRRAAGTLNQRRPQAMPQAMSVEPTPVENAPSAP